jgi:hypothetical protein
MVRRLVDVAGDDLAGIAGADGIGQGVRDHLQENVTIMGVLYLHFNKNLTFSSLLSMKEHLRVLLNSVSFRGALFSLLSKSRSIFTRHGSYRSLGEL